MTHATVTTMSQSWPYVIFGSDSTRRSWFSDPTGQMLPVESCSTYAEEACSGINVPGRHEQVRKLGLAPCDVIGQSFLRADERGRYGRLASARRDEAVHRRHGPGRAPCGRAARASSPATRPSCHLLTNQPPHRASLCRRKTPSPVHPKHARVLKTRLQTLFRFGAAMAPLAVLLVLPGEAQWPSRPQGAE